MIGRALVKSGLQSGTIMGIADLGTQLFVEGRGLPAGGPSAATTTTTATATATATATDGHWDAVRTLRWASLGLVLHGPYFFAGFSFLDRRFAAGTASSWTTVAKKTAAAQALLFPPYLVALFGALGLLEGDPDVLGKIRGRVPEAFASGCVYWPIANAVNFGVVPNRLRIPYLAVSSGAWNSYLSYSNQR